MNTKNFFIHTIFIFALSVGSASASITTYDRAGFGAAVGAVTVQNFDSITVGTILGTLNGVTYGASNGQPIVTNSYLTTTGSNSLASTSAGFFGSTETATFTFATPITAFGIDINTFAMLSGDYVGATTNLGNVALSEFDPFPGDSTGQFIGFTSTTPFTTVTLKGLPDPSNNLYTYTLDTLVYGSAAPEPSTLAGLGIGLSFLGLVMRKRR